MKEPSSRSSYLRPSRYVDLRINFPPIDSQRFPPSPLTPRTFFSYPLSGVGFIAPGLNLRFTERRVGLGDAHLPLAAVAFRDRQLNILDWDWGMRLIGKEGSIRQTDADNSILRFEATDSARLVSCDLLPPTKSLISRAIATGQKIGAASLRQILCEV